jgi:hypothetical protein
MQETSALILSGAAPDFEKENTGRWFSKEKYIMKYPQFISMDLLYFLGFSTNAVNC